MRIVELSHTESRIMDRRIMIPATAVSEYGLFSFYPMFNWITLWASLTRWMWIWVNFGSWWWTGRQHTNKMPGNPLENKIGNREEKHFTWHLLIFCSWKTVLTWEGIPGRGGSGNRMMRAPQCSTHQLGNCDPGGEEGWQLPLSDFLNLQRSLTALTTYNPAH